MGISPETNKKLSQRENLFFPASKLPLKGFCISYSFLQPHLSDFRDWLGISRRCWLLTSSVLRRRTLACFWKSLSSLRSSYCLLRSYKENQLEKSHFPWQRKCCSPKIPAWASQGIEEQELLWHQTPGVCWPLHSATTKHSDLLTCRSNIPLEV